MEFWTSTGGEVVRPLTKNTRGEAPMADFRFIKSGRGREATNDKYLFIVN